MKPARAVPRIALAMSALRAAQTHLGRARQELPLGSTDEVLRWKQQDISRLIEELRKDFGRVAEMADPVTAAPVAEEGKAA